MKNSILALATIAFASPAFAATQSIQVDFREGAPTDSFTIKNNGACAIDADVSIDLASSLGKLIFDTTATGVGVEVFQPFVVVNGAEYLTNAPTIIDGQTSTTLQIAGLTENQIVRFTIDVDDTLKNGQWGQIRVSGSEIEGAKINVGSLSTTFGKNAKAELALGECPKA